MLECYMQRLGPDQASVGRETTQAFHKARDPVTDGVVDVESNKDTHGRKAALSTWPFWFRGAAQNEPVAQASKGQILSAQCQVLNATFPTLLFFESYPAPVEPRTSGFFCDHRENCVRSLQSHGRRPKREIPGPPVCQRCRRWVRQ